MRTAQVRNRRQVGTKAWLGLGFSASIMVGGFFQPLLGLAVPALLAIAVASNFLSKRWFCSKACPRGSLLSGFARGISRYKSLPPVMYSRSLRAGLCGFLMFCALGQTMRLWPSLARLGQFFWIVCIVTFALAAIMAVAFKPRAWCALCPLGTLQDTISSGVRRP